MSQNIHVIFCVLLIFHAIRPASTDVCAKFKQDVYALQDENLQLYKENNAQNFTIQNLDANIETRLQNLVNLVSSLQLEIVNLKLANSQQDLEIERLRNLCEEQKSVKESNSMVEQQITVTNSVKIANLENQVKNLKSRVTSLQPIASPPICVAKGSHTIQHNKKVGRSFIIKPSFRLAFILQKTKPFTSDAYRILQIADAKRDREMSRFPSILYYPKENRLHTSWTHCDIKTYAEDNHFRYDFELLFTERQTLAIVIEYIRELNQILVYFDGILAAPLATCM